MHHTVGTTCILTLINGSTHHIELSFDHKLRAHNSPGQSPSPTPKIGRRTRGLGCARYSHSSLYRGQLIVGSFYARNSTFSNSSYSRSAQGSNVAENSRSDIARNGI